MKFLASFLLCAALLAQNPNTAVYPGAVSTDNDLTVATDRALAHLTAPAAAPDNGLTVDSTAAFRVPVLLIIDNENIKCLAKSPTAFTSCSRGIDSAAGSHAYGAPVRNFITSWDLNQVKAELKAVQSTLGPNLANVTATLPLVPASAYNFTPQTPGGSLANGANTISLAPVPLGMNGTDSFHWVQISGGTGTAEPCLIIGGTAVAGAASGQLIIQCTGSHTGAWTIQSTVGGIPEAVQAIASTGGTVVLSASTYTSYALLTVPSNVTLQGQGAASVIRLAANAWPAANSGPFYAAAASLPAAIATTSGASNVRLQNFALDLNGANQTNNLFGASVAFVNASDWEASGLTVSAARHAGAMLNGIGTGGANGRILNNTLHGYGGASCAGGIFWQGPRVKVAGNYVDNLCDEGIVANGIAAADSQVENNTLDYNNASFSSGIALHCEGCVRWQAIHNKVRGLVAGAMGASPLNGNAGDAIFEGNAYAPNATGAAGTCVYFLNSTAYTLTNVAAIGNDLSGCGAGGAIGFNNEGAGSISKAVIAANVIHNGAGAGMSWTSGVSQLSIALNMLYNNAGGDWGAPPAGTIFTNNQSDSTYNGFLNALAYSGSTGAVTASTATLVAPAEMFHVSGTSNISGISAPPSSTTGVCVKLIPDAIWHLVTGGNIGAAATAIVGKVMSVCEDVNGLWWPSY